MNRKSFCKVSGILILLLSCFFITRKACAVEEWQYPVDNYTSLMGSNVFARYGFVKAGKYHLGDDVSVPARTDVRAIGNGTVKIADDTHSDYGGLYVIEHTLSDGNRVCSLYAHLNVESFNKRPAETVCKGEYLGKVGTTAQNGGWSEHLHFGIRKGGYPSDGNWVFWGYTANASDLNNWYSPTNFISNWSLYLPYRRVANVAWYPPNKSCVQAERWRFFADGCNGMSLGSNSICYQEAENMMAALGFSTNWWDIIYGPNDLNEIGVCSQ